MVYRPRKEKVMKQQGDMGAVVRSIRGNVGNHVKVTKNMGRNRYDVVEGTITETYPCIFTIKLDEAADTIKTASYSYVDVYTKDIQLQFG